MASGPHLLALARVALDGRVDPPTGFFRRVNAQGKVLFFHHPVRELARQVCMRTVVACNHQQAAGFLVQAVNYARAVRATFVGQFGEMV